MERLLTKISARSVLDAISNVNERTPPMVRVRSHSVVLICILFITITLGLSVSSIVEFGWSNERLPGPVAIGLYLVALFSAASGAGPVLGKFTCHYDVFLRHHCLYFQYIRASLLWDAADHCRAVCSGILPWISRIHGDGGG